MWAIAPGSFELMESSCGQESRLQNHLVARVWAQQVRGLEKSDKSFETFTEVT